jgi:dTDP-D-glucose 4,6-dehydratase
VFGENFEETRRRVPDVRRAADILGFQAETALEDGLKKTIEWFLETWPRDRLAAGSIQLASSGRPARFPESLEHN